MLFRVGILARLLLVQRQPKYDILEPTGTWFFLLSSHYHPSLNQAYMVVCLDMSIDQDVDIVFSEYILWVVCNV